MNVEDMLAHGWKFRLSNGQLVIASEQDANSHVELSSEAAFSLLDYLYQYRNVLASSAESDEKEPPLLEQDKTMVTSDQSSDTTEREEDIASTYSTTPDESISHPSTG